MLYLTTNSVGNKLSRLTFNIHASLNAGFTCKTNGNIITKGLKNIADIFKIFIFVTSTPFFYKQSIFDPRPENCLSFSKKSPPKTL